MKKEIEKDLGGEFSQMQELLIGAIESGDKDGAVQVYAMMLYHLAFKHNPTLVTAWDNLMKDL